jgi:hypothetical protein
MLKIRYRPDQARYSEDQGMTNIEVKLDGGFSRVRKDLENAAHIVNVQWSLNLQQYKYMGAFYRKGTEFGTKPFLIDLWMDYCEIEEYEARIINNSWKLASQSGERFIIQAKLEVIPQDQNVTEDCEILGLNLTPPPIVDYIVKPETPLVISAFRHLNTFNIALISPPNITSSQITPSQAPVLMGLVE